MMDLVIYIALCLVQVIMYGVVIWAIWGFFTDMKKDILDAINKKGTTDNEDTNPRK